MGKVYDASGNKMNVEGICLELANALTAEQKELVAGAVNKYEDMFGNNSQAKVAHGILDTYRLIESTSEQGMRVRKLMDNLMTKYQKSTSASTDDQVIYSKFITSING